MTTGPDAPDAPEGAPLADGAAGVVAAVTERVAPAERAPLTAEELEQAKRDLFLRLFRLFKVSSVHHWKNEATRPPLDAVLGSLADLGGAERSLSLQVYDEQVFFGGDRVRYPSKDYPLVQEFYEILHARGIGGVTFEPGADAEDVKHLMGALREWDGKDERPFARVAEALAAHPGARVAVNRPRTLRRYDASASRVDSRAFVIATYAKAPAVLRRYIESLDDPDALQACSVQAQRVVQDLVDICALEPDRFRALFGVKNEREAFLYHATNTAVLCILLGHHLELAKPDVADLGYAALFHDVGRIFAARDADIGGEAPDRTREHPARAVEHFLESVRFGPSNLRRMLVAYEHNTRANGYPPPFDGAGPGLLSEIVALGCAYDALTSPRPDRPASPPDEALRLLWEQRGTRYDADLVRALVSLVGYVPIGAVLQLDSGEVGVVVQSQADPELAGRPRVVQVRDAAGRTTDGPLHDLAERDARGDFVRSPVRWLDPDGPPPDGRTPRGR